MRSGAIFLHLVRLAAEMNRTILHIVGLISWKALTRREVSDPGIDHVPTTPLEVEAAARTAYLDGALILQNDAIESSFVNRAAADRANRFQLDVDVIAGPDTSPRVGPPHEESERNESRIAVYHPPV